MSDVLQREKPCPRCKMEAYIVNTAVGHKCTFCNYTWPYEEGELDNAT